jgi:hypothetical protein
MKRTSRRSVRRRSPRATTVRRTIRLVGRAPLQVLVWLLAGPIVWLPLGALLLSRLGLYHLVPLGRP